MARPESNKASHRLSTPTSFPHSSGRRRVKTKTKRSQTAHAARKPWQRSKVVLVDLALPQKGDFLIHLVNVETGGRTALSSRWQTSFGGFLLKPHKGETEPKGFHVAERPTTSAPRWNPAQTNLFGSRSPRHLAEICGCSAQLHAARRREHWVQHRLRIQRGCRGRDSLSVGGLSSLDHAAFNYIRPMSN